MDNNQRIKDLYITFIILPITVGIILLIIECWFC